MSNTEIVIFFEDKDGKFYLDAEGSWSSDRDQAMCCWEFQLPHIIQEFYDWNKLVGGLQHELR